MANFNVSIAEAANATDQSSPVLDATLTPAGLRAKFPGFADSTKFPDAQMSFYVTMAYKLLSPDRWGSMLDEGAALFTAHFVALDRLALTAGVDGIPGAAVGVLSGGGVDKVNYTRDVASVMEDNAGHWGMTTYGLQYLRFARMMGMGPVQVGATTDYGFPQSAYLYGGAWPGPFGGA